MINKKKIIITVMLFTLVFPLISHGETFDFEMNANSTDVEGKLNAQLPVYGTYLSTGVGIITSEDDDSYWLSNLNAALKDNILSDSLTFGLGFKGLFGQAEVDNQEYKIRALNFFGIGEYDFRRTNLKLPLSLSLSYSMSPTPLNFSDTKKYQEFIFTVYGHIVGNAAIIAGYRNIDARFDADPDDVKHSEDAYFFGIKLIF